MAMPDQPAAPARDTAHSFRLLVDGVRDYAIFMLDGAGRVLTWNTGAQRLKAYGAEEIIGKHFSCFYPEEAVEAGQPARLLAPARREGRGGDEGWLGRRGSRRRTWTWRCARVGWKTKGGGCARTAAASGRTRSSRPFAMRPAS